MRRFITLAMLFGFVLSAVPAGATTSCPVYEGYPDCTNRG
jgi:hypothetical protein